MISLKNLLSTLSLQLPSTSCFDPVSATVFVKANSCEIIMLHLVSDLDVG